jgi:hypothetical protein
MLLTLERLQSGDEGTFGIIQIEDKVFVTGELPWRDNEPNLSCIPTGTYRCEFTFSPRFNKKTYCLMDVPGRNAIRIHSGNFCGDKKLGLASHVDGCILIGRVLGNLHGQMAVLDSKNGLRQLEEILEEKEFYLEVIDVPKRPID